MSRRYPAWPSFEQGEVSPLLAGRIDQKGYYHSCELVKNFLCLLQGPVERRPGTRYVAGAISNSTTSRLVPFKYSADVYFVLELGEQSMRFFSLGSPVVESERVVTGDMELDVNWSDAGTPTVNEQSAEQAHTGTYSRKFTVDDAEEGIVSDNFTTIKGGHLVGLWVFSQESSVLVRVRLGNNSGWAYSQVHSVAPGRWTWIWFSYTETYAGTSAYLAVLSPTGQDSGTWYVDDVSVRKLYEIATAWSIADLEALKFRQVGNTMYFCHPDYALYKLVRSSTTSWSLSEVDLVWGPFLDQNTTSTTIAPSATTGSGITLTASDNLFQDGHIGAQFKLVADLVTEDVFSAAGDGTAVSLSAGDTFIISLSGTWSGTMTLQRSYDSGSTWVDYVQYTANATTELVNLEDDIQWRWQMSSFTSGSCTARITEPNKAGYVKITAVASATSATADVIEDLCSTNATTKWSEGAFSEYRGYPRALEFFEQRLVLAHKTALYGSVVDDYESFERGTNDDDAWAYTLAGSEVNYAQWLVDADILHIGTTGDEWKFGDSDDPTTPTSVNAKRQTYVGSADIDAIKAGDVVIFVEDGRRGLRSIHFNWEQDKYLAEHFSRKAEHLFKESSIKEVAYTARPTPIIWVVLADGALRAVTFDRMAEVSAYHRHDIGSGSVESICSVRGSYYDELWMVVRRQINGATVRYIEQLQFAEWTDKADAFYVDSGLTLSESTPTQYWTGLAHLEGQQVKVLADGAVHAPVTINGGIATLKYEVSKVQIGLGYGSVLTPMPLEVAMSGGDSSQAMKKSIHEAVVRLYKAMACRVGTAAGTTDPITFRTTLTPLDQSPDLFSGDKQVTVRGHGEGGKITIECDDPVPLTVIGIWPKATITTDH